MPVRVQRRRAAGWRLPPGAVVVDRTTRWGNPFRVVRAGSEWHVRIGPPMLIREFEIPGAVHAVRDAAVAEAVARHREHLLADPDAVAVVRRDLAGRDLVCWCPLPAPGEPDMCHAVTLVEVANSVGVAV